MINPYLNVLELLSKIKSRVSIVVVGANDGKVNDPIYNFSSSISDRSSVCLIEPNPTLIPYLKQNYSSHPSHKVANCAVGKSETLTLYAIKEEFWEKFQPAYAEGWPVYRASTGITSASREHLEKALASHSDLDSDEVITALSVPSKDLETVLLELDLPVSIDVLQIDTEGHDDSVIYASSIQSTRPKLIYFESCHISSDNIQSLLAYLANQNYRTYQLGGDTLAIHSRLNPICIALNGMMILSLWTQKFRRSAHKLLVSIKSVSMDNKARGVEKSVS